MPGGRVVKRKGSRFERQVAKWLSAVTGHKYERVLTEAREASWDVVPAGPISHNERLPIGIVKRNGSGQAVIMTPEVFAHLAARALAHGEPLGFVVQCKVGRNPPSIWSVLGQAYSPLHRYPAIRDHVIAVRAKYGRP